MECVLRDASEVRDSMSNELCGLRHTVPGHVNSGLPGSRCQNRIRHTKDLLGKCLKNKGEEVGTGRKGEREKGELGRKNLRL